MDLGIGGGEVGLFLGYDQYFSNNWVLGIEGGAQWRSLSGVVNAFSSAPNLIFSTNMQIQLKSECSYDVALRFGHKVYENSLWYVKAGAQFTLFKLNTLNNQTNTMTNVSSTGAPLANKKAYRTGALGGVGVEIPVTSHCSLGAEYTYTAYQAITANSVSNLGNGDFIKVKIRPYENQLVARILLKM
jgi:opacity protein-like surface antigen